LWLSEKKGFSGLVAEGFVRLFLKKDCFFVRTYLTGGSVTDMQSAKSQVRSGEEGVQNVQEVIMKMMGRGQSLGLGSKRTWWFGHGFTPPGP
jgi:hypothetical protein